MATSLNGIKKPIMTPQKARDVLREILNDRKEIPEKSVMQINALHVAAMIVEQANEEGANLIHEAGILRYHANNIGAALLCDDYTRNALKAAIRKINGYIAARGGDENA